jgi:GTP cyclohydrolase-4
MSSTVTELICTETKQSSETMSFTDASPLRGEHRVAIALGSNIGDRAGNIVAAIHKLRRFVRIERISSVYETAPIGYEQQPDFLNLALTGWTAIEPHALHEAMVKIERQVGRHDTVPLGPRAIDLDLILYDDRISQDERLTLPHPGFANRAFVLVPLAEIAPDLVDPRTGKTIAALAHGVDRSGVTLQEGGLLTRIRRDVQEARPTVALALNRVGVRGIKALVSLQHSGGLGHGTVATMDIYADLDAAHSGVHMSRFSQDLEDALAGLPLEGTRVDDLAVSLASRVVESQNAERAEVCVQAPVAVDRVTPASALPTREFFQAMGRAVVTREHRRRLAGVQVEGITACPCAQAMVADYSRERLLAEGFSEQDVTKILTTIPIATHNQRGIGTLLVGSQDPVDFLTLVEIVEQSMSAETYDLLKRPDELFVVNKAHQTPRFVEDVVREMLRYTNDALADFPGGSFVLATQVNLESIHKHDAVAQTACTLDELRRELRGENGVSHTTLEQWLAGTAQRPAGRPVKGIAW